MSPQDVAGVAASAAVPDTTAPELGQDQVGWLSALCEQARSWYLLAERLRDERRLGLAGDLLARASQLEPGSPHLREATARAQFAAGQYLGAHTSFAAMAALQRGDAFALYGLALCEARLGELETALDRLTDLARRRPGVLRFEQARALVSALLGGERGPRVRLPSYRQPPVPIAPQLLALELGEPGETADLAGPDGPDEPGTAQPQATHASR